MAFKSVQQLFPMPGLQGLCSRWCEEYKNWVVLYRFSNTSFHSCWVEMISKILNFREANKSLFDRIGVVNDFRTPLFLITEKKP